MSSQGPFGKKHEWNLFIKIGMQNDGIHGRYDHRKPDEEGSRDRYRIPNQMN